MGVMMSAPHGLRLALVASAAFFTIAPAAYAAEAELPFAALRVVSRGGCSSADQRLNDVDEVLHPLFGAASGPVGRIEDVGQILEPAGGDQGDRERGGVEP